jgi:3-dehydroquinate synthase
MSSIECNIQVSWQHRVMFADHVFAPENLTLSALLAGNEETPRKALVVLDESLAAARPALAAEIVSYFESPSAGAALVRVPMIMEGGERSKNSGIHVAEIQSEIERHHIDRHNFLLAVGGGALLDVAGFAAATAHRGVRHLRIPTTTLSQCDSGVGVKNGINAFGKKNFIGTFAPPFAVLNDFDLLSTLPARHKRAGYAEAVKVACIRDGAFFERLEHDAGGLDDFKPGPLRYLIHRCAELHVRHIATSGDPFETSSTRPLDFGHWAAHKLEQLSNFEITHGEAVAIGIALDALYSNLRGYLDPRSAERILCLLEALGFELFAPELFHASGHDELSVLRGLDEFREHMGGQLAITLLRGIGEGFEVHEMSRPHIVEAIGLLQARQSERSGQRLSVVS